MSSKETVKTLHPLEIKLLHVIQGKSFDIAGISTEIDLNEAQTRSGVNWLEGKGLIQKKDKFITKKYSITEKGKTYTHKTLLEISIHDYIKKNDLVNINDLMSNLDYDRKDIGSSFGFLKKNNEIRQNKDGSLEIDDSFNMKYYEASASLLMRFKEKNEILEGELNATEKEVLNYASQIQLYKGFYKCKESETFSYQITPEGKRVREILIKDQISGDEISQITPEILKEKKWKEKRFREYNINLPSPHILIGKKHPYREFLDFLKYKFVGLGFKEMRGSLVETEFWNMDALYMPQTHPARDIHDEYLIKDPPYAKSVKEPYFSDVAKTHEDGGKTHSRGWGYTFNRQKAKQLILRSQGTVLSARTLADKPLIPGKYFSIARCFRYDKVDSTHLADFFQMEGIVLSEDADFSTLLGLLKLFAEEITMAKEIKYVPGYFPFTEPSVEVHIKHPELGWYELGGSGIFRPEVTQPLGVNVPVLAWGLGVDRMAMMALGFNDIRDLFSRDLDLIRDTKMEMSYAKD